MKQKIAQWISNFKPPLVPCCLLALVFGTASIIAVATDYLAALSVSVSYTLYVCAALSLALAVWAIVRFATSHALRQRLDESVHRVPIAGRMLDDFSFRTLTLTYNLLAVNVIFTLAKGVAGWFSTSWWLITLSAYYLILCIARFLLLKDSRKIEKLTDETQQRLQEWRAYRVCGVLLMTMTLILFAIVVLIMVQGNTFTYYGVLIFAVALWDFYCLTSSIIYMVRTRKKHTPIIVAIKTLRFGAALVSMLSLQTAMFASFGHGDEFQDWMNLATGSAVSLALLATGLAMLIKANREIKLLCKETAT